jgi:hypothetical protein
MKTQGAHFEAKWIPEPNSGCHLWLASVNKGGYGRFGSHVLAHRYAWEQINGPIPDGMLVCHKCDNPACVNVDHMFLGTHLDNANDRDAKNRRIALFGERHGRAKLTVDEVKEIRHLIETGVLTSWTASKKFGINHKTVSDIVSHKLWASVPKGE